MVNLDGYHDCHDHHGRNGHQGHHSYDNHQGQYGHHGWDGHHGRGQTGKTGQTGQKRQTGQTGKTGQTGQTKLTLKLDFPGKLCRAAAFAILAMFYIFADLLYNFEMRDDNIRVVTLSMWNMKVTPVGYRAGSNPNIFQLWNEYSITYIIHEFVCVSNWGRLKLTKRRVLCLANSENPTWGWLPKYVHPPKKLSLTIHINVEIGHLQHAFFMHL